MVRARTRARVRRFFGFERRVWWVCTVVVIVAVCVRVRSGERLWGGWEGFGGTVQVRVVWRWRPAVSDMSSLYMYEKSCE